MYASGVTEKKTSVLELYCQISFVNVHINELRGFTGNFSRFCDDAIKLLFHVMDDVISLGWLITNLMFCIDQFAV